ncbi:mannose-6-phosphate receptor binding domain-containing protein [Xylaria sp. CBS 124048]|nr:mannose-6-phosphate receptor binding domain-containing protein [Xylaria sp. CBS 124048]
MRFSKMVSPPVYPATAAILSLLALTSTAGASDSEPSSTTTACTASSTSGSFFDLRSDIAIKPKPDGSRPSHSHGAPLADYKARGYDYGANFTLNICNAVVDPIEDVQGVEESKWQNISAYYVSQGDYYSLGFQSGHLVTRGKELVLQYTGGSPCEKKKKKKRTTSSSTARSLRERAVVHAGASYRDYESEEEEQATSSTAGLDESESEKLKSKSVDSDTDAEDIRRKSATLFFSCDRDLIGNNALVSFIAVDPDECAYVFKVKSPHACSSAEPHKPGSVGPGSVFAIILIVAVLVYFLGGIFYNRTVGNARGMRQLPNYTMWASIWSFIYDMFIIATSSCARLLPSRRGYHHLSGTSNSTRARNNRDAENRLIDQYDEEWED